MRLARRIKIAGAWAATGLLLDWPMILEKVSLEGVDLISTLNVEDHVTGRGLQITHVLDREDGLFRGVIHFSIFILCQDEASLIKCNLCFKRRRGCAKRVFEI